MSQDHPHRAGSYDWITFLVTGPEDKLMAWQAEALFVVELFDRRAQTVRCRAHGDDEDRGQRAYERALILANHHDVTLPDLVDTGKRENEETQTLAAAHRSRSPIASRNTRSFILEAMG
jgi:hypothetical protein